ncbi:hypothetical protein OIU34_20445 [Pararhizobium sp. BT-229]|uniref:hypothetical protein n=1 Tax=Pararhizobium sp. BT-229 TaxID=2986923 RepID=UPI0021F72FFD|nr:hypothetical protein [Pararhizobium sp. BT-229]MCV9964259.1 hypothetical protein [Pararhizobium sp. BT-229]
MEMVAIELETWVTDGQIQQSFEDVAKSISEGYGAGTIALDGYTVYPGFWSLYDKEEQEGYFVIRIEHEDGLNDYQIAGAVTAFAKTYKKTYKRPGGVAAITPQNP